MTQSMARFIKCSRQLASALHPMTPTSAPTPSCLTVGKDPISSFATGTQVVRTFLLTSSLVYLARLTSLRRQQPPLEQQLRQAMLITIRSCAERDPHYRFPRRFRLTINACRAICAVTVVKHWLNRTLILSQSLGTCELIFESGAAHACTDT